MDERSWSIGSLIPRVMKTLRKPISENIEERLMSSQEDSLVSLFPMPVKGGGQTDDRYLWPEMLRVINEVRPTWVVGENVAGIGTMVEQCRIADMGGEATLFEKGNGVHRYSAELTFTIERICKDLESEGYSVQPVLIPACAVGAPHRRDRIFFIAHYTNGSDDLRESGQHESESGKERLSERNQVRKSGKPSDVRPEVQSSSTDSYCDRRGEVHKHIQSRFSDGQEPVGNGWIGNATDTIGERLEGSDKSRGSEARERMYLWRNVAGCGEALDLRPEGRWKGFPTVSAVHRGNDGLPFDVDCLAIPFAKWRTESIKAYGNAIVPQVMYRIFEAIKRL